MDNKKYKEYDQCPICGDLLKKDKKEIICKCCGFVAPVDEVPSIDDARLNQASDSLRSYSFDDAFSKYSLIVSDNINGNKQMYIAGLWGKLLANFGVVYVKDMNNTFIPTFAEYDPEVKSILKSSEYQAILDCDVDEDIKKSYLEKAKALDEVYKRIDKELSSKEEYDVFI